MGDDEMTIQRLIDASYDNSRSHGFWDQLDTPATIPMKLALIHSEISEALESYRDEDADTMVPVPAALIEWILDAPADPESPDPSEAHRWRQQELAYGDLRERYVKWQAKPKGFDIELADALIRIFDLAGAKGIDLEGALRTKMRYNEGRPPMHGRRV